MIGDTVNLASRLERLTREINAQIVVTNEVMAQVRDEGTTADGLLDHFARRGDVHVAGRIGTVTVWTTERRVPLTDSFEGVDCEAR